MCNFQNEEEFRTYLLERIREAIRSENLNFEILESRNVLDIIICRNSEYFPVLILIEVKLYKKSSDRIGIGDGNGCGFQPEILRKNLNYFNKYSRWVLRDENGRCIFTNNETIKRHLCSENINLGQQNNISPRIFDEIETIDTENLINQIVTWMKEI